MVSAAGARATREIAKLLERAAPARVTLLADALFEVALHGGVADGRARASSTTPAGKPAPRDARLALLLEDIQDPGNVGTLLRSAAAAGAGHVLLSRTLRLRLVAQGAARRDGRALRAEHRRRRGPRRLARGLSRHVDRARGLAREARSTISTSQKPVRVPRRATKARACRARCCERGHGARADSDARHAWNRSTPARRLARACSKRCGSDDSMNTEQTNHEDSITPRQDSFKYYEFVMVAFVVDPHLLEPDRAGEDRADRPAAAGRDHLRRGRALLPDLVRLRRRAHRGVRLRAQPARDLGGLRGRSPSPRSWRGSWWRCRRRRSGRTRRPTRSPSARPGASRSPR